MTLNTTPIEKILDNGLKLIILELPQATGVTCLVNYNVSSRDESVENTGINQVFISTMNSDNDDIEFHRPRVVYYVNHTALNFSMRPDQLNHCFELNARMMTVPVLTETTMGEVIDFHLKYRADKRYFLSDEGVPVEFKSIFESKYHPNGYAYTPMATPESAARIDITQMRQWHQRYYSPGNACLIVAGNVKADEVTHLAKQHFDVIPSRPKPPAQALQQPCELDRRHVLYKDTSRPRLLMVPYMAGMRDALADQSGGALSILSTLFEQKLRTLPSVSHGTCRYDQDKYVSLFSISVFASTPNQSLEVLEADIQTLWDEIKFNPLPADELEIARQRALATLVKSDDHEGLALELGRLENYRISFSALNQRQRDVLNVTAQDIQRIACTCFSPQRTTVVHMLPLRMPSLTTTAELTLSNGLKVMTLENPHSTKVVCAMHFRVSKRDESADNSGITELVGRMLAKNKHFMGEQKFQFWNYEDFILCVITVDPEQLNNAFKSLAGIMGAPTLTVEAMGQVIDAGLAQRERNLSLISDYSIPEEFEALAFPSSGYGNLPLTPESAAQIDLKQVQDWHRNYYCASNACLVIVGNVKAAAVEQWVQLHFGALPLRSTTSAPKVQELREPGLRRTTLRLTTKAPRLLVAFNVPGQIDAATDPSSAALQIISELFELNCRMRLPVASGICVLNQDKHAGLFRISLTANNADQSLEELETALLHVIEAYKLNGAPAEDLEMVRRRAVTKIFRRETNDEAVAFDLFRLEDSQLPLTLLDQRYDRLLEVTNEDIQRAANTYFTPERMTVAHILPMQAPMQ